MKRILTRENVRDFFEYDGKNLIWKERPISHFSSERSMKSWNSRMSGTVVGNINNLGYRQFEINLGGVRERYLCHRVVWLFNYGEWPKNTIDHIDHNTSNNMICNLRDVTIHENNKNISKNSKNTSGVCGVSWNKGRGYWEARIRTPEGRKFLGGFDSPEMASDALREARKKHGYHENHGR